MNICICVFVIDRPRVVNMHERLYLPRGLLGRIDCLVESNPPQTVIVWSKDGRLMDLEKARHLRVSRHGSLVIKPVSMFDEGKYTCTPYSPLGPGDTSSAVQVFVRGSSSTLFYEWMNEWMKERKNYIARLKAYKCMFNLPRLAEN